MHKTITNAKGGHRIIFHREAVRCVDGGVLLGDCYEAELYCLDPERDAVSSIKVWYVEPKRYIALPNDAVDRHEIEDDAYFARFNRTYSEAEQIARVMFEARYESRVYEEWIDAQAKTDAAFDKVEAAWLRTGAQPMCEEAELYGGQAHE